MQRSVIRIIGRNPGLRFATSGLQKKNIMHIVMTGATGFIGSQLCAFLRAQGYDISALVRDSARARKILGRSVMLFERWHDAPLHADAVINLAGAPIVGKRWSAKNKDQMRASRLSVTQGMVAWLPRMHVQPEVIVNASAVGFYGYHGDEELNESSAAGADFGAQLCRDWEQVALQAEALNIRVCRMRFGVVLSPAGGALARMLPAFKFGMGGPLGDGQQWFSWVHLQDLMNALVLVLNAHEQRGAFNVTAPNPVRNGDFTDALAQVLHRPAVMRMPAWALHLLMGEGADILLRGQRVLPQRLLDAGFQFQYPTLASALAELGSKS